MAPGLVLRAESDTAVEERAPTPKEPSPTGDNVPGPPCSGLILILVTRQGSSRPSSATPPDDFKEHQALLRRVASNLGLEVEEMAEQPDT